MRAESREAANRGAKSGSGASSTTVARVGAHVSFAQAPLPRLRRDAGQRACSGVPTSSNHARRDSAGGGVHLVRGKDSGNHPSSEGGRARHLPPQTLRRCAPCAPAAVTCVQATPSRRLMRRRGARRASRLRSREASGRPERAAPHARIRLRLAAAAQLQPRRRRRRRAASSTARHALRKGNSR